MTTEERILKLVKAGYTANIEKGIVYNRFCKEVNTKGPKSKLGNYKIIGVMDNDTKNSTSVLQHQFIWYLNYGYLPECIDHIDRNPSNNRIDNLRGVTSRQNSYNRGAKGYYFDKKRNKYRTGIYVNGKTLGREYYNTEQEAIDAYAKLKEIYHKI